MAVKPIGAKVNYDAMRRHEFVAAIKGVPHLCNAGGPAIFPDKASANTEARRLGGEAYRLKGNHRYMIRFN